MSATQRVAVVGLGPIGLGVLRSVRSRAWARVVAAVDIREELVGRDVGELLGSGRLGVPVAPALDQAAPLGSVDTVLLCTGSRLASVTDQVLECLSAGAAVVSTCEELAYPWYHHPDEARRIDEAARAASRAVIATGVNPGFAMDALAMAISGIAERVDGVRIHRVVDAATRRGPLQLKVGAGIDASEFTARKARRTIGHVGLVESVAMLGAGMGWALDSITETLDPVLADVPVRTAVADVPAGSVAGISQRAVGVSAGREVIGLDLEMYLGAADPGDSVTLDGDPPISAVVRGLHGDIATAAILVNAAGVVAALPPGLRTMIDLQPLRAPVGPTVR